MLLVRVRPLWARLRPIWGGEGAGAAWLGVGVAVAALAGLALQLLGLRVLDDGAYATFVFGLGIGNVAAALASAIQPVVAVRVGAPQSAFLPATPLVIGIAAIVTGGLAAALLAPRVGLLVAVLALLQVPVHAVVGVGVGRLQGRRAFGAIAAAVVLQVGFRIAVVLPPILGGHGSATVFVLALPASLLATLVLLLVVRAYRGTDWRVTTDGRRLLGHYALWALFAWVINADAVVARLLLSAEDADAYALAFTLGRQPLYVVAPLTTVLLPVALAAHAAEQRERLRAVFAVSALVLVGTVLALGVWTEPIIGLLTGDPASGDPTLVRGYAVVGPLAAAATLLLTFGFALGCAPRLRALALLTAGGALAATVVDGPGALLLLQAAVMAALVALCAVLAIRATAPAGR